jgi:group I intron endonuclease
MDVYGYVYLIRNKVNGKIYVGQTTDTISQRWSGHKTLSRSPNPRMRVCRAIKKYGEDAFDIVELHRAFSKEELDEMEIRAIASTGACDREVGYNTRQGGSRGRWSAEHKQRMSRIKKEFYAANPHVAIETGLKQRGKTHTEEARARMSASRLGVPRGPQSPEHRAAIQRAWDSDPTFRARKSEAVKNSYTPELLAIRSRDSKARWNTPEKIATRDAKQRARALLLEARRAERDTPDAKAVRSKAAKERATGVPHRVALGATGFRGVTIQKKTGKAGASIKYDGRKIWLGTFSDVNAAAEAYNQKALELHGDTAILNTVPKKLAA